jgi:hypothetical protein
MLIATFGPSTAWVGKTIAFEDEQFILEGHGPITASDVMEYDRQGHLLWASDGTRAWVGARAQAAQAPGYPAPAESAASSGQPRDVQLVPRMGRTGFIFSLLGFGIGILWPVGLVLSWRDLRRAKRENLPSGLALPGLIISSIGTALFVVGLVAAVAIPMFLNQREVAKRASVKEATHTLQVGIESWAVDHGNRYPDPSEVTQSGLASYVDSWPINPYTGLPMTQGAGPGDFRYTPSADRRSFSLVGYARRMQ